MTTQKPLANPGPLGLIGFGMTTVLLNLHNAGIIPLSATIISMGLMLGGLAQIIAGLFEFKTGNTFGATAFTAYGCFWWSLIFIWMAPNSVTAADKTSMGFYLLIWGIFSAMMFVGTLKHNRISQITFLSVTFLFLALAAADFTGSESITHLAGWIGIFCGSSAIYSSVGQIVNGEFGKTIFPL